MSTHMGPSRDLATPDLQPRLSIHSSHGRLLLPPVNKTSSGMQSSATWTSNSSDLISDTDEITDRDHYVDKYNRLAQKYSIRPLVPDNPENFEAGGILPRRNWWSRTFRRTSSQSTENSVKRKRSIGHVTAHVMHLKRDSLKDQDLQGLVRLCGKSFLYLPPEYAPGSLILPTCFRATAQHLVQHAPETRGVFRIPGSVRIVNELYEFYCADQARGDVSNTVRSPNLPSHIHAGVHDVASLFKKFLAGLPGGILGSLSLFDALVAINSQLHTDPEFSRTKQSKIRARLIALAIGTLRSQYRRELICAVFGLLCLLGRAAETAPREDEFGRPLPTSDLMGYNSLGIVFGPLLIGDILGSHALKSTHPSSGLLLVPNSPVQKSRKEKRKTKELGSESQPFLDVDRIHVANDITEMMITNWRDVIRQMRNLDGFGALRHHSRTLTSVEELERAAFEDICAQGESIEPRSEDHRPSLKVLSRRTVSFKTLDNTDDDALAIKKTRPDPAPSASKPQQALASGVLSSPRGESLHGDLGLTPKQQITASERSLRSPCIVTAETQTSEELAEDENISSAGNCRSLAALPPPRALSPCRPTNTSKSTIATQQTNSAGNESDRERATSCAPSIDKQASRANGSVYQIAGSPERVLKPKFPGDLNSATVCAVVPSAKIFSGKSTVRFQPKIQTDLTSGQRTKLSKQSLKLRDEYKGFPPATFFDPKYAVAPCQMDGASDVSQGEDPRNGPLRDLGAVLERQGSSGSGTSLSKGLFGTEEPWYKAHVPYEEPPWSSRRILSQSAIASRDHVSANASHVRGLAAMFDNAAKSSSFASTPGDVLRKQRREIARVVSPYTSNPSPLTSLQSPTSRSMPGSRSKYSVPTPSTVDTCGRGLMPSRRQDQDLGGFKEHASKTEEESPGLSKNPNPSRIPVETTDSSNMPLDLLTPSRIPVRKKTYDTGVSPLAQVDGDSKSGTPLSKGRQELRGICNFYSTTTLPSTGINVQKHEAGARSLEHRIMLGHSARVSHSRGTSPINPSPSRGRSASKLREEIHRLRQELSTKNEECAQLRLQVKETTKARQVNETLLRQELDSAIANSTQWKRRADMAELRIEQFERMVSRIGNFGAEGSDESFDEADLQDDFSFICGFEDHIHVAERSPKPLSEWINQGRGRKPEGVPSVAASLAGADAMSDCSGSTVVRNMDGVGCDGDGGAPWSAVDGVVGLAGHRLVNGDGI